MYTFGLPFNHSKFVICVIHKIYNVVCLVGKCSTKMVSLDYSAPFKKAERPFGVSNILTLSAGPCTVSPRVLHALSAQTLQPLNGHFDKVRIN